MFARFIRKVMEILVKYFDMNRKVLFPRSFMKSDDMAKSSFFLFLLNV